MDNDRIKVKSLEKAIKVLDCFVDQEGLSVTEISEKLDLYKSNVHNILATFKAMGYLEQDEETDLYYLGAGVLRLGRALGRRFRIGKVAQPYMQALANLVEENVFLAIPNDDCAMYLDAAYPAGHIGMIREMRGFEAPMYCTGLGKAMLAFLPEKLQEDCASRELKAYTDNTITEKEKLLEELKRVQISGFAIDNMEHEFGVKCVAVPVLNSNGQVVAGMSITGKASDIDWKRENEGILLKLKECVLNVQKHLI